MKIMRCTAMATATLLAMIVPAFARAQSQIEQTAIAMLAEKFGLRSQQVADFGSQYHQDIFDLAPALSASYYSHHSPSDVMRLRQQGLGWGEIAHKLNMNPGTFNKLRKQGAFDRDSIWSSIYHDHYGVSNSDVTTIKNRGGSERDILHSLVIAHSTHRDPLTVYNRYAHDRNWDRVEAYEKVQTHPRDAVARPADEKGRREENITNRHGDGDGIGNGKGHGKNVGDGGRRGKNSRNEHEDSSKRHNEKSETNKHGKDRNVGDGDGNGNRHEAEGSGKGHGKGD